MEGSVIDQTTQLADAQPHFDTHVRVALSANAPPRTPSQVGRCRHFHYVTLFQPTPLSLRFTIRSRSFHSPASVKPTSGHLIVIHASYHLYVNLLPLIHN